MMAIAEAHQASPVDRIAATGETVLVVEDEPVVRGVILEMLRRTGLS